MALEWSALLVLVALSLLLAVAVVGVGWLAYSARLARERRASAPDVSLPDPADELVTVNRRIVDNLREARAIARDVEQTVRRGLRG